MYVNSEQMWVVGTKVGDNSSVWMKNPETPATSWLPTFDWTYKVEGGEWIIDSGLVSIPQKGSLALINFLSNKIYPRTRL